MRFQLESSSLNSFIKAGFTSVIALAIFAACSDTISAPEAVRPPDAGIFVVETQVPEAEKNPPSAVSGSQLRAPGSASLLVAPSSLAQSVAMAGPYSVSAVAFGPEAAPTGNNGPICDDCVMYNVPLGFDFAFYGVAYSTINISSNGFVGFGGTMGNGCCKGGAIPSNDVTNNIIALGWSDWRPQMVSGGIKWETRGEAPNRRFVLQFNNVPEFGSTGRLTVQLVLEEETHDITIHTTGLATFRSDHLVTQGIENATGSQSAALPGRVRAFLKLNSDAVKFSPAPNLRPVLSIPGNISLDLAIGSCSPVAVDVGRASATDDTDGFTILGERSDFLLLEEPYPAGVTTIQWTVTDLGGLKASANQTVSINDKENPSIVAPANLLADNDPGLGSAVVDAGAAVATDNCAAAVEGVRSDAAALSAPFPVGVTTITWTARDEAGNSAVASQTVTVRDVEAPVVGSVSDISVDATSRSGAVVSFSMPASDNVGVISNSCTHQSGSVFPDGNTTVTCTARDAAGNHASASFVVHVRGAGEQLGNMIESFGRLDLSNGVGNPMLNQLRAALNAIDGPAHISCKKLDDFIKLLNGSKALSELSAPEISDLLATARRIQSVLGCA